MPSFPRITFDPAVMGGKACVRNLRVTVGTVVGLLDGGRTPEEILKAYPYLERADIDECLAYAAWKLEEREMTTESHLLERITARPDVFGGKPIVRDLRIAVEHILGMLAAGDSARRILEEYPFLEPEDLQACLVFAHRSVAGQQA